MLPNNVLPDTIYALKIDATKEASLFQRLFAKTFWDFDKWPQVAEAIFDAFYEVGGQGARDVLLPVFRKQFIKTCRDIVLQMEEGKAKYRNVLGDNETGADVSAPPVTTH